MFYIEDDLNSDNVIIKCLDAMLKDKYIGYTFYVHNFGKYDVIYILNVIIKVTESNPTKYSYNIKFIDDIILSLIVSTKVNNKRYKIKIVDSYNLLQSSLNELCNTFNTDVKKSFFPYSFVNRNNLFYVGEKPDINFYDIGIHKDQITPAEFSLKGKIFKF